MLKKLEKTDLRYTIIIYYLWSLCDYFSETLSIECGDSPFSPYMLERIIRDGDNKTEIRLSFPNITDDIYPNTGYEYKDAKELLNEYLHLSVNLDSSLLSPYRYGDKPYDVISPLYLSEVYRGEYKTDFYFYYIDNQLTYREVEKDMKINQNTEVPQI